MSHRCRGKVTQSLSESYIAYFVRHKVVTGACKYVPSFKSAQIYLIRVRSVLLRRDD